jgi:Tol biopolymer transport system component
VGRILPVLALGCTLLGCEQGHGSQYDGGGIVGPGRNRVGVGTTTTGSDLPSGYTGFLTYPSGQVNSRPVGLNQTAQIFWDDLADGQYSFRLEGVPVNCVLTGDANPSTFSASLATRYFLNYVITCTPNVGTLQVHVESELDDVNAPSPGNYQIVVDGVAQTVPACAPALASCGRSTYINNARVGTRIVSVGGLPVACRMLSENPQSVSVAFGATTMVLFRVDCSGQYGTLRVVTNTTGLDQDPDDYFVDALGQQINVGLDFTYDFNLVAPGNHPVTLLNVASNCLVSGPNPGTGTVAVGQTATVTFNVSCAPTSRPILFESTRTGNEDIFVMEADGGRVTNLTAGTDPGGARDRDPAWSPDGRQIVFRSTRDDGHENLWLMESGGEDPRRITNTDAPEEHPEFSRNGDYVAFDSDDDDGSTEIYRVHVDTGAITQLTDAQGDSERPQYSPVADLIVFASDRDGDWDIYTMPAGGGIATNLTLGSIFDETDPAWSPDGSTIVFSTPADGDGELWTMSSTGGLLAGAMRLTNNNVDDTQPYYSSSGQSIVFTSNDGDDELLVMPAGGGAAQPLTSNSVDDSEPEWRR